MLVTVEVMDMKAFRTESNGLLEVKRVYKSPNGWADVQVRVLPGGIECLKKLGYEDAARELELN